MRPPPPDAGDESALAHAALVCQEWQRIRDEAATSGRETYDQDHDLGLRRAQTAARHRQDVADCVREVDAVLTTDIEGGESLATVQQSLLFRATTLEIAGYGGTVPCGSTVTATFSVSADGWYTAPISTSVVVPC